MILYYRGMPSRYEIENVTRLFFLRAELGENARPKGTEEAFCYVRRSTRRLLVATQGKGRRIARCVSLPPEKDPEFFAAQALFDQLCAVTGYTPSWGMLTGVRPVSFLRSLAVKTGSLSAAEKLLQNDYRVSREKIELAAATARVQQPILSAGEGLEYSLYVSIPFCPTRCSYCSFVSRTTKEEGYLIPDYVKLLCRELADTAAMAGRLGLRLKTVYIGGGTPTAISASQLFDICNALHRYFPMGSIEEFTVEAGRPDTITPEKLSVIRQAGADRISVNPQTLNDEVLAAVGRPHTARDFLDAFALARSMGFCNINADLIAGLPKDTPEGFRRTMDGILAISPENVTVHTLTLKRASNLVIEKEEEPESNVALMLRQNERLLLAGYQPYYLYRQKNTLQNLENTGFTKPGKEGLYNIYIMEEVHSILSCGAGGSTKLKAPHGSRIERIFNYKYPGDYIAGYEKLLQKKQGIEEFYARYLDSETAGGGVAD